MNMQNKINHTALPWQVKDHLICGGPSSKADKHYYIESIPKKEKGFVANVLAVADKDTADFVVEACNSYYELIKKADDEMERVKACEHIAEGEEGWEKLTNLCPSTMAVALLKAQNDELLGALEQIKIGIKNLTADAEPLIYDACLEYYQNGMFKSKDEALEKYHTSFVNDQKKVVGVIDAAISKTKEGE